MLSKKILPRILDGCLEDNKTFLAGNYRGFQVIIDQVANRQKGLWIQISAHREDDTYRLDLLRLLDTMKAENRKITAAEVSDCTVSIVMQLPGTMRKYPEMINPVVSQVVEFLRGRYYVSGCMECGTAEQPRELYLVNGRHSLLCPECAQKVRQGLEGRQEEIRAQKSSLLPGLVGAMLGCLAGIVVWILVYRLGYIAGISGLVMAVLSLKGYEKLGGALDRKGVVICLLVMLGSVFLANKLAWAWAAYDGLKDYGYGFFDCYQGLGEILEACELSGAYFKDLAVGYFLTLLCTAGTVISSFRASNGSFTMKKVK